MKNECRLIAVVLLFLLASGCVINFKSEKPTKGLIHVDVQYIYPGKNEMNSVPAPLTGEPEGFYKKELELGHYAQTKIALDPGQQILILNKAFVLHFYDMPVTIQRKVVTADKGLPQSLRIHADSLDRTIHWDGPIDGLDTGKYHLGELMQYVDSIVKSTDEYQGLPSGKR